MKVRISGHSLRFRVSQSDFASLQTGNRVETTVHLGPGPAESLTFALECSASGPEIAVRYIAGAVTVMLSSAHVAAWSAAHEVGIYESLDVGRPEKLDLILEKDFACLDGTDAENADTFPNPATNAVC
jgi:hypothetical protein